MLFEEQIALVFRQRVNELHFRICQVRLFARAAYLAGELCVRAVAEHLGEIRLVEPDDFQFAGAVFYPALGNGQVPFPRFARCKTGNFSVHHGLLTLR